MYITLSMQLRNKQSWAWSWTRSRYPTERELLRAIHNPSSSTLYKRFTHLEYQMTHGTLYCAVIHDTEKFCHTEKWFKRECCTFTHQMAWSWGWHSCFLRAIWGSNLFTETGFPNGVVVLCSSYRKTTCRCLRLGYNLFLPHPFHFIIHYNATIQRHTDRHKAFWNKQYLNNIIFHVSIVQDELLSKV